MKSLIAAIILQAGLASAAEPACSALPISRIIPENVHGYINRPGAYCLGIDIRRIPVFDFHRGRMMPFGQGLVQLACDSSGICPGVADQAGYDIDLQGHTLISEAPNMKGIENVTGGLHVAIRNGRIEVPGDRAQNIGVDLRGGVKPPLGFKVNGEQCWPSQKACEDIPAELAEGRRGPEYLISGYVIDRMQVRAGFRAVQMGGGGNILRNSVIEVDSSTAAFLFGSGAIIENNTIIIHGKGKHGDFDAALKLRDAHGAIIRNNTFIYRRGFFSAGRTAINLLDSRAVIIEGNTFEGFEQPVRVHGATTYTLK